MKTDTNKSRSTPKPRSYRRLWISLIAVMTLSFLVLGYYGGEIYRQAPPIPKRVITPEGQVLFTAQEIKDGQNVWQSIGGQQVGSIWGHGAYVAPDWSGDWLHWECVWLLDHWAAQSVGKAYEQLPGETQAALRERLKQEIRMNNSDQPTSKGIVIYACSGCSDAGELADHTARELSKRQLGERSCLAGIGGRVKPLLRTAAAATHIVAVDGCPSNCARPTLSRRVSKLVIIWNFTNWNCVKEVARPLKSTLLKAVQGAVELIAAIKNGNEVIS